MATPKTPHPAVVTEVPLDCPDCGEIHSNTLLERTGGKCPKAQKTHLGLQAASVSLGWGAAVECRLNPSQRWNGFACPYFTREQLPALFDMITAGGEMKGRLDDDGIVRIISPDYGEDDPEEFESTTVNGVQMWAVGAWCWAWHIDLLGACCPHCGEDPDDPVVGDHCCPSCGRTFTIRAGTPGARDRLTSVKCPACEQRIYRHDDGVTECGGEGDGTCAAVNYASDVARGITDPEWLADDCDPPSLQLADAALTAHREVSDGDAKPAPSIDRAVFARAVTNLSRSAASVLQAWEKIIAADPNAAESDGYPFDEDFEEVCLKLSAWAEAVRERSAS